MTELELIEAGEWRKPILMKKTITFNTNFGGKTHRVEELEGRRHLVVDVAMIPNDGVMAGSDGAYFYPKEENLRSMNDWNHVPIMNYHPEKNGNFVSGRSPEFINSRKLGVILNTRVADDVLRSEAWFDEARTKELAPTVYENIVNNKAMEGSTGLTMDSDETPGEKGGEKYKGKVGNYRPDHYAVLLDKKGAFPVAKGGGFFANSAAEVDKVTQFYSKEVFNREWTVQDREKLPLSDFGEPKKKGFPIDNQEDVEAAASLLHHAGDPAAVKRRIKRIAERKGFKLPESWGKQPGATASMNAAMEVESSPASTIEEVSSEGLSHSQTHARMHDALSKKYGERGSYWNGWVEDLYPQNVVYHHDGDLYQEGYTADDKGVKLGGDRKKVERRMMYKTCNEKGGTVATTPMDKKTFVNQMIVNGGYKEEERTHLESLSEDILKIMPSKFAANQTPPTVPPVVPPPTPVPADLEAELKKMNPLVANQIRRGIAADNARKEQLVGILMANEANVFSKEFYDAAELNELEGLVAMIPNPATPATVGNQASSGIFLPGRQPQPVFFGNAGAYNPVTGAPMVANAAANMPKEGPRPPELTFGRGNKPKDDTKGGDGR